MGPASVLQGLVRVEDKTDFHVLACPETGQRVHRVGDRLQTDDRARSYPVVREIPRFVAGDLYTRSFSFEWNVHKKTQLDSFRNDRSSEDIFRQKTGLTPDDVRGKLVLDAGIGAGRFSDVLVSWGARVVGIDLSYALEAAAENLGHLPQMLICQADIGRLPFRAETFDYIVSIGVLHHTPDTKRYASFLPRFLKPGGELAIWVYPDEGDYLTRRVWIPFTSRIPQTVFYKFCRSFVPWAHRHPDSTLVRFIRMVFPFSAQGLGLDNDVLDTFDGYSPRYHGVHSPAEVEGWFKEFGLVDVRRLDWHTAVRGRRAR